MKICPECNSEFLRRNNAKYCSLKCQQKFLSKRHYQADSASYLERSRKRRAEPIKWEAEKKRANELNKMPERRGRYNELRNTYRSDTVRGRVIGLNAHVRYRCQSDLQVAYQDVLEKFGEIETWFCATCHTTDDLTFDHIIAFIDNGEHIIENLQILCRPCNSSKGSHERWKRNQSALSRQHPTIPVI